jgi:membrane-associated phospholipid phosphatase
MGLVKILVSAVCFGALVATRSPRALAAVAGLAATGLVCRAIKNVVRQPRPNAAKNTDFGMPSSHSAALAFFASAAADYAAPGSWAALAAAAGIAIAAAASRVWSREHTVAQVAVGFALGAALEPTWRVFVMPRMGLLPDRPAPPAAIAAVASAAACVVFLKELRRAARSCRKKVIKV